MTRADVNSLFWASVRPGNASGGGYHDLVADDTDGSFAFYADDPGNGEGFARDGGWAVKAYFDRQDRLTRALLQYDAVGGL